MKKKKNVSKIIKKVGVPVAAAGIATVVSLHFPPATGVAFKIATGVTAAVLKDD